MPSVYVSPSGSDVTGDGTERNPWGTIPYARDQAVALGYIGVDMAAHCNIRLIPGLHRIDETFTHGPEHSGQNGFKLIYSGAGRPGTTRILASTRATGWTVHAGNVWKCAAGTTPIHTIYDNGRRCYKARFPKHVFNVALPMARGPYVRAEVAVSDTVIQYPAASLDPDSWGDISQLEVVIDSGGSWIWFTDVVPVSGVNTGTRQITLTRETRYQIHDGVASGSRFYCQNALALLTDPGEFVHDPTGLYGDPGTLYYRPWTGVNPNLLAIEIPLMKTAFEFLGTSAAEGERCHDIELRNLAICYTDFTNDYTFAWRLEGESGEGHVYGAADRIVTRPEHRHGIVTLTDCERITIRDVELGGAGYSGIHEFGFNKGHVTEGVWVHNTGMNGHYCDGPWPGEGDVSRDNRISNALFSNCGEVLVHGAGSTTINAGHNIHEDIEAQQCNGQAYFFGAYAFGGGGFPAPTPADLYAHGNQVRRLKARNVCQDRRDAAAFGIGGIGSVFGQTPLINYLDGLDAAGVVSACTYDIPNVGVYTDNATDEQDIRNAKFANVEGVNVFDQPENGHQTYVNVQGVSDPFDPDQVPACGVTDEFPF